MKLEKLFDINGSSQEFNESPQLVREGRNMNLNMIMKKNLVNMDGMESRFKML